MNQASKYFEHIKSIYHPNYLQHEYYYTERLKGTINQYIKERFGVRIVSIAELDTILRKKIMPEKDVGDYCLLNNKNSYRLLTVSDDNVIKQVYQSYFLDSHEIGMHLFLLFHSKYGTRFLSSRLHLPSKIISDIRHNKKSYKNLPAPVILRIENFYLNSKLEKHILRQKIDLKV